MRAAGECQLELSEEYAFIGEKVSAYYDRSLRQFFLGFSVKTWQNTLCLPFFFWVEKEAQFFLSSSPFLSALRVEDHKVSLSLSLSLSLFLPPSCTLSRSPPSPFFKSHHDP